MYIMIVNIDHNYTYLKHILCRLPVQVPVPMLGELICQKQKNIGKVCCVLNLLCRDYKSI